MKATLTPGLKHSFAYKVPVSKTVPHLDEGEGSVGVHVDVSHTAATPPGLTVTVEAECIEVRGPRAKFKLRAHDGVDEISIGTHDRFIVAWNRFDRGLAPKRDKTVEEAPA